jgi:hypothetical protein
MASFGTISRFFSATNEVGDAVELRVRDAGGVHPHARKVAEERRGTGLGCRECVQHDHRSPASLGERQLHAAPGTRRVAIGADGDQGRVREARLELLGDAVAGLDGHVVEEAVGRGVVEVVLQRLRDLQSQLVALGVAEEQLHRGRPPPSGELAATRLRPARKKAAGLQQHVLDRELGRAGLRRVEDDGFVVPRREPGTERERDQRGAVPPRRDGPRAVVAERFPDLVEHEIGGDQRDPEIVAVLWDLNWRRCGEWIPGAGAHGAEEHRYADAGNERLECVAVKQGVDPLGKGPAESVATGMPDQVDLQRHRVAHSFAPPPCVDALVRFPSQD